LQDRIGIAVEAVSVSTMNGTSLNIVSFLFLGFFLGMRHATDADHVVAIATIVSRERSVAGSALIGAAWGVGHTITVMAVGAAIIVFGVVIPPRLGLSMEFAVGMMLILLGVLTLTGIGRAVGTTHAHVGAHDAAHQREQVRSRVLELFAREGVSITLPEPVDWTGWDPDRRRWTP